MLPFDNAGGVGFLARTHRPYGRGIMTTCQNDTSTAKNFWVSSDADLEKIFRAKSVEISVELVEQFAILRPSRAFCYIFFFQFLCSDMAAKLKLIGGSV